MSRISRASLAWLAALMAARVEAMVWLPWRARGCPRQPIRTMAHYYGRDTIDGPPDGFGGSTAGKLGCRRARQASGCKILGSCFAVCATELGLSLGKKCGRCSTRYCGPECQVQHWKEGGHDKLCKKIKKAGGAEQYNANKKYAEAVAVAVEACADDTKGQTCYICTQALHWKTKEGLVRGCACRGTAGFAHVSCLAEQAKILCDGGRGEQFGAPNVEKRGGAVVHVRPVRATVPRRRAVRARMGVLEDVRGAAGGGPGSVHAMKMLGNGLSRCRTPERGRVVRERGRVGHEAHWRIRTVHCSPLRAILRARITELGRRRGPAIAAVRILWVLKLHGAERLRAPS